MPLVSSNLQAKLLTHFTQLSSCLGVTRVCSETRVRTHATAEGKAEGGMGHSGGPCVCVFVVCAVAHGHLCFLGSRNMNVKKRYRGKDFKRGPRDFPMVIKVIKFYTSFVDGLQE